MIKPESGSLSYLYTERIYRLIQSTTEDHSVGVKSTQKVLIVLPLAQADPKSTEGIMLDKMLSAVNLDRSGCRLVEAKAEYSYQRMEAETAFEVLLSFGPTPADFGLQIEANPCSIVNYREHKLIFCPDLTSLASDVKSKKVLWESLKAAFPS